MVDVIPVEYDHLLPVFHLSVRVHVHTVHKCLISEILLHFGNLHHALVREFLELPVIDVSPVHGDNLFMVVIIRGRHERVIGCGRGKLYVAQPSLIGVYDGVYFDAAQHPWI